MPNSIKLFYQEYLSEFIGKHRSTLIIIHGLFGSSQNWHKISSKLSCCCKVIAVDLRNHGNSPHADTNSYSEFADDLNTILNSCTDSKVVIMGHSMGGKVAMACSLMFPKKVHGLIVCDIAPVTYSKSVVQHISLLQQIQLTVRSKREAISILRERGVSSGMIAFFMKSLVVENGVCRWKFNIDALANNMEELCTFPSYMLEGAGFDGPSLFIRGGAQETEEDRFPGIQEESIQVIKKSFNNSIITTIEGAGHWLHINKPNEFYECVTSWLRSNRFC